MVIRVLIFLITINYISAKALLISKEVSNIILKTTSVNVEQQQCGIVESYCILKGFKKRNPNPNPKPNYFIISRKLFINYNPTICMCKRRFGCIM
jgi:hypothetical protein